MSILNAIKNLDTRVITGAAVVGTVALTAGVIYGISKIFQKKDAGEVVEEKAKTFKEAAKEAGDTIKQHAKKTGETIDGVFTKVKEPKFNNEQLVMFDQIADAILATNSFPANSVSYTIPEIGLFGTTLGKETGIDIEVISEILNHTRFSPNEISLVEGIDTVVRTRNYK